MDSYAGTMADRGARRAAEWQGWLSAHAASALAALFAVTKVAERLRGLRRRHDVGNQEIVILLAKAAVVAVAVWLVRQRARSRSRSAGR